ncbi:serine/threonine-protein kinase [Streptacidiphilus rugosus]|uniref:serine/threonine-protein kinase n=1 Tax=Streptacidiphilus rugosus TaxID=405783 RepID=UPI0005674906|nr:serine/threonine-protein kinase [Streptacidiphilus rugosus]
MNGEQQRGLLAGRYRLESVLGQGGMGTVWRAEDSFLGRDVAVKELRFAAGVEEDEQRRLVARTLTEAKAIARVRHTAAVTVYDVVEEDGRPWIVMELVESRSLSEVIQQDGVLPPQRAAEVALELLGVLAEAHRVGILHRDVKPSNVLIGHDGRVVLTDFGIARVEGDPSVTSTGMLVGAPSYISPERARGGVPGPPADMWSLGATLFAMVEGVPPYDKGSALSTLTAVMTEPVPPLVNGGLLGPVIEGLLHKDPAARLEAPTVQAMLRGVIGEYERRSRVATQTAPAPIPEPERTRVQPAPVPQPAVPTPPARRNKRALVVGGVVLAVALLITAVAAMNDNGGRHGSQDGTVRKPKAAAPAATPTGTAAVAAGAGSTPTGTDAGSSLGYQRVDGPGGASIEIPDGWRVTRKSGSVTVYTGPAGTLDIEFSAHPLAEGALRAWQKEETSVAPSLNDYHRIKLAQVDWRGWDAADWEWTFRSGGTTRHSLNRGFVVDAGHAYAIYWTAPEASWADHRSEQLLTHFFKTFKPGG